LENELTTAPQLIVIVSIHQPSTALFQTFDKLLILAEGKTCYSGAGSEAKSYFDRIGYEMPLQINPAEFILDLVNTDFTLDREGSDTRLADIQKQWESSAEFSSIDTDIESGKGITEGSDMQVEGLGQITLYSSVLTLLHRSLIKSFRDIIAYGVRIIMYFGKLAPLPPFCCFRQQTPDSDNPSRIGHYGGNRMAAPRQRAGKYPAIHQCFGESS
jgi:hypothetical protein